MPRPSFRSNEDILSEFIRVNHSGEYGAVRIYRGQIDTKAADMSLLKHMYDQELEHLDFFEQEMKRNRVRPSIMLPFWHFGGYFLGFVSGVFGKKAAMLCTEAVEEVIDAHYLEQIHYLSEKSDERSESLCEKIKEFRQDEIDHKNIATANGSGEVPFFNFLSGSVKALCRLAIALSKRI